HFPGSYIGSLAARLANAIFEEIVLQCDCGIDLHTASTNHTNFPHIRAAMANPLGAQIARAFGCGLIISSRGPKGSLRREALRAGIPVIVYEAGESNKIEPAVVEVGISGIRNVLASLEMIDLEYASTMKPIVT